MVTIPVNFRKISKFFADIPDWSSFPEGDRENKDVYYNVFSSTRSGKKNGTNNEVISLSDGNKKKASTFTVVTNSWMNSMHRNESFANILREIITQSPLHQVPPMCGES